MSPDRMDNIPPPLSVEIPTKICPSYSIDSSISSPTGILGSQSPETSSSSLPVQSNVTFAPLPKLAPRKRRSGAVPLGVAARSELMRRRRGYVNGTPIYQTANPMWTDEEITEQTKRINMTHEERRQREEEAGEDPFVTLGKMVKVASKHIWRKVSQKDLSKHKAKAKDERGGDDSLPEHDDINEHNEETRDDDENASLPVAPGDISSTVESRRVLAAISSGGEPEQTEHDEDHLSNVGQTETIVEGHTRYSWVMGKSEELERSKPAE